MANKATLIQLYADDAQQEKAYPIVHEQGVFDDDGNEVIIEIKKVLENGALVNREALTTSDDLDLIFTPGTYRCFKTNAIPKNYPVPNSSGMLIVFGYSSAESKTAQILIYDYEDTTRMMYRSHVDNLGWTEWTCESEEIATIKDQINQLSSEIDDVKDDLSHLNPSNFDDDFPISDIVEHTNHKVTSTDENGVIAPTVSTNFNLWIVDIESICKRLYSKTLITMDSSIVVGHQMFNIADNEHHSLDSIHTNKVANLNNNEYSKKGFIVKDGGYIIDFSIMKSYFPNAKYLYICQPTAEYYAPMSIPYFIECYIPIKKWERDYVSQEAQKDRVIQSLNPHYEYLLKNILCIGDSLTEGIWEERGDTTYPEFLEKLTGTNVTNAGNSGYAPSDWWINHGSTYDFTPYKDFIVWLGTNNGMTDTLETDVIPYDNYNSYAETETGYYCRIISKIIEQVPKATIYLGTVWKSEGDVNATNSVIRNIADLYPNNIVGVAELNDGTFEDGASSDNKTWLHPYDGLHFGITGNLIVAEKWISEIRKIVSTRQWMYARYNSPISLN